MVVHSERRLRLKASQQNWQTSWPFVPSEGVSQPQATWREEAPDVRYLALFQKPQQDWRLSLNPDPL